MASITNKVLVIIALVLVLIGWAVALGGIAKENDVCNKMVNAWNNSYNNGNGNGNSNQAHKDCSDMLSYHWWGIWFSFFLAIVILIMSIMGKVENWVSTLQAFCATCLSVTMIDANMVMSSAAYRLAAGDVKSAADAALAGFIIVSIALMLLIIFIGMGSAGVNVTLNLVASSNKTAPEKVTQSKSETTVEKHIKVEEV